MNTVKEIADFITAKQYWFQVSIPKTNFSHGKTSIDMALSDSESVEHYLNKIVKENKAKSLFVKFLAQNGGKNNSSFLPKGEELIFLPSIEPVANQSETSGKPVENQWQTSGKPVANQSENQSQTSTKPVENTIGTYFETQKHHKNTTMTDKDYIEFKVLEMKYDTAVKENKAFEARVNKLEKKIEELHDENKNLLRDNLTKEDKHELALERTKLEMERESKDGLSGIVDFANNNPETIKMLIGLVKPDHPMFKADNSQPALEGANDAREIKYTEDSETNTVLNDIPRTLSQKDGDTIAAVYLLFKKFVGDPEILKSAVKTFIPEYTNN